MLLGCVAIVCPLEFDFEGDIWDGNGDLESELDSEIEKELAPDCKPVRDEELMMLDPEPVMKQSPMVVCTPEMVNVSSSVGKPFEAPSDELTLDFKLVLDEELVVDSEAVIK